MTDMALSDVRVLDLTQYIAGPYATKLMADYGAEVIKIERPDGGDPARRIGPFFHDDPHHEKSGLFLRLNTNKKSVSLDLHSEAGKRILRDLVRDTDILVESFTPGTMAALGLSYEELEQINPKLVMVSLSSFGQWGPYRDYQLTELTLYAISGMMYITGFREREPIKLGLTVTMHQMGNAAAAAAMGAFFGARYQGIGQHLDFSMAEAETVTIDRGGLALLSYEYSKEMSERQAIGGEARHILPSGVYPCADGYVFLNAVHTGWWPNLCRMIGHPELLQDPRFKVEGALFNLDYKDEIDTYVFEWLMERNKQQVMEESQAAGYAGAAINTMEDLFRDPHFRERGFFVEIDHPVVGTLEYPGAPFHMQETPWRAGRAPLLGEHTREVLGERLNYSAEDMVLLRESGAI